MMALKTMKLNSTRSCGNKRHL